MSILEIYPALAIAFSFAWIAVFRIIGCPSGSIRIGRVIWSAIVALVPVAVAAVFLPETISNGAILIAITSCVLQALAITLFAQVPRGKAFLASLIMNAITYRFWMTCSVDTMVLGEVMRVCLTLPTCIVLGAAAADLLKTNPRSLLTTLSVGFTAALLSGCLGVLVFSRRFGKMCILFVLLLELLIRNHRAKEGRLNTYFLSLRNCTLAALPFLINFWLHESYFAAESRQLHNWVQGLMTIWFMILPIMVLTKALILRCIVRWGSFGRCCTDALLMTLLALSLVGVDSSFGDSGLIMRIIGMPHGDFSSFESLTHSIGSEHLTQFANTGKLLLLQAISLIWLRKQRFLPALCAAAITDTYLGMGFVWLLIPVIIARQVPAWYQRSAKTLQLRGNLHEAYESLKKAIRFESLFPGNANPWLAGMYLSLGNIAFELNNMSDAEAKYKSALSNYITTYGYLDDSLIPTLTALKNAAVKRQHHIARDWYDHWLKTIDEKLTTGSVAKADKEAILTHAETILSGDYKVPSTMQLYAKLSVLMILPTTVLISIAAWWVPEYCYRVTHNVPLFEKCIDFQRSAIGSDEWYRIALGACSNVYARAGDYSEADRVLQKAIKTIAGNSTEENETRNRLQKQLDKLRAFKDGKPRLK